MKSSDILTLISELASQSKYSKTKHAQLQMIERNLTNEDILDILINPSRIIRINSNNPDGITSYKIEGGSHDHRLAIKLLNNNEWLSIITAMDKK